MAVTKHESPFTIRPGYVRRAAAAKYLGISLRALGTLQARRLIPFSKLGARTVVFRLADLDAAVARLRVDAVWEG